MRSRNHHHRRATQELGMKLASHGAAAALHEVMFRFHLEKCRMLSDGETFCSGCMLAAACVAHHALIMDGTEHSLVEIVEAGESGN